VFRKSRDKLREGIQLFQKERAQLKIELKESLAKKPTAAKNPAASSPPASSGDSKTKRTVVFDQLESAAILKAIQTIQTNKAHI
jgi:polygalacturonase